jgi:4-amino-4-deoxy-L-arabinose transferase-like glycosyltransferase
MVIAVVLFVCVAPFLKKAIHTDDVLFVRAAQWIQKHPINFFGSQITWWTSSTPMWVANLNPPLFSYFLAAVGTVLGWSEIALHLGGIAVAIATALGIYSLAERWCERPLLATLVAIVTPAFLVSSTTLMCDIMALGFWVWAVFLWDRALMNHKQDWRQFALAGALAGLAFLSKYNVITVFPLLPIIGMLRTRKLGLWLIGLLVPLVIMAAYELLTARLYGRGLFFAAVHFSSTNQLNVSWQAQRIINLTFAGGSLLPLLFFAPALWRRSVFLVGAILVPGILLVALRLLNHVVLHQGAPGLLNNWKFVAQALVLSASALHFLLLAAAEAWQRRDNITRILILWIAAVFVFATILNWTINVRSFLPMVPPAAILMVRRLEVTRQQRSKAGRLLLPLAPAALLALGVGFSDYQLAGAARAAALKITSKYERRGLWFEGHGAFQYYMEAGGARPLDVERTVFESGDIVIVPEVGIITPLPDEALGWVERLRYPSSSWIRVMGGDNGPAGFYTAIDGPLPFAFGKPTFQNYFVLKAFSKVRFLAEPANPENVRGGVPSFPMEIYKRPLYNLKPEAARRIHDARESAKSGNFQEAFERYAQVLREEPDNALALIDVAWLLATAEKPELRNGPLAVRMASRAVELTDHRQIEFLQVLAAAFAESHQFDQAVETTHIAAALALVTGHRDMVDFNEKMLSFYSAGTTLAAIRTQGGDVPRVLER